MVSFRFRANTTSRRPAGSIRLWVALTLTLAGFSAILLWPPAAPKPGVVAAEAATLERGEYLAKAGNCYSCHTVEGGEPFAGGVPFNTPFGRLYSTNITPDPGTGLGDWSFNEFYAAMKAGLRPDGSHLYPAFPYTAYAKMSDDDIAALYRFIQSLPPVKTETPANDLDFPYSQRFLLGFWKRFYHDTSSYRDNPNYSAQWNRGAYLVEGPGHCGACHSPRNVLGAERDELALSGGIHQGQVKRGGYRLWSAVNLTSDSTGLGDWSKDDLVDYLKTGISERAVVNGPMRDVVMNSTRHLSDADLDAMAVYLKSLSPKQQDLGEPASAEVMKKGEVVYTVHCGSCHLPTGLGDRGLGVSLAGNAIVQAPDPSSLINIILYGPHLPGQPFKVDRSEMKMFGKRLSDQDIAEVASYIRGSFGNRAGAVTPDQVKIQR